MVGVDVVEILRRESVLIADNLLVFFRMKKVLGSVHKEHDGGPILGQIMAK